MASRKVRSLSTASSTGSRPTAADLLHGEVTSPAYDAVHRRAVVFVAGEYWLIFDALRAARPHDYAVRWHLADDVAPSVETCADGSSRVTTPDRDLQLTGGGPAPSSRVGSPPTTGSRRPRRWWCHARTALPIPTWSPSWRPAGTARHRGFARRRVRRGGHRGARRRTDRPCALARAGPRRRGRRTTRLGCNGVGADRPERRPAAGRAGRPLAQWARTAHRTRRRPGRMAPWRGREEPS